MRWASTRIPLRCCGASLAALNVVARRNVSPAICARLRTIVASSLALVLGWPGVAAAQRKPAHAHHRRPPAKAEARSRTAEKEPERQLAQLARILHDDQSFLAYSRLSDFANGHASGELGARAALALGYYDYTKARLPQAQGWLQKAQQRETLLREYVLYWCAQVNRGQGRHAEALAELEMLRREFPESAIADSAVQSLAETSLALGDPEHAIAALDAYEKTATKLPLLFLRAQARDRAGRPAAAGDYLAIYYRYPLTDEARTAARRIPELQRILGPDFPAIAVDQQLARAAAFFDAHHWRDALDEYQKVLPELQRAPVGIELQRVRLRIAESRVQLGASPGELASLQLTDPELDAERLYAVSQAYRSQRQEPEMLASVEQLASRYPLSRWTEEGLFATGNYFWVNLDRQRAASYYRRTVEQFPVGKNAQAAQWRQAWVAYLDRRPEAESLLEEHIRRFPGSSYTVDALYWLGRASERGGNVAHARSFYLKAQERYPETYFGRQSAERLRVIGTEPINSADFLALIPPPPPLPRLDEPIPPAAAQRWTRAKALETIAFDASAELELRAGYAATNSPRLLWEVAEAARDAGHYPAAIVTLRQVYPQMEARKIEQVPVEVWRTLLPLPYQASLMRAAGRNGVDPMLAAGVIRQESIFQADAVSHAGAVGLMQVLPKTGKKLARRLRLRFTREKLFDPEYNLQLGTLYLADLIRAYGNAETALAAYNAGEDRVAAWTAERNYEERPEFVESIPFTETREYVQIVLRNAELYRLLYAKPAAGS